VVEVVFGELEVFLGAFAEQAGDEFFFAFLHGEDFSSTVPVVTSL
jgi:hypothetical protein